MTSDGPSGSVDGAFSSDYVAEAPAADMPDLLAALQDSVDRARAEAKARSADARTDEHKAWHVWLTSMRELGPHPVDRFAARDALAEIDRLRARVADLERIGVQEAQVYRRSVERVADLETAGDEMSGAKNWVSFVVGAQAWCAVRGER